MRIADCQLKIADWRRGAPLVFLMALSAVSCNREQSADSVADGAAITRSAEDRPVRLTLKVAPPELPFQEKAVLTVEAVADSSVSVTMPDYADAVAQGDQQFEYRLRPLAKSAATPIEGGKLRWSQRFAIEFFLPGEYTLPPAKVTYSQVDNAINEADAPVAAGTPRELTTETITIKAQATEAAQLPPEELKKIEVLPPVELKEPWSRWWIALIPTALIAAAAFLLLKRKSFEGQRVAEVIPAHEWARRQFAALVADDLIGKGEVQEFYYRISAIVRGYIERRFGVSAPEMTTEEFLAATAGDFRFGGAADLQPFMTACDLVKYARQRPAAGEWNQVLRTAGDFVERTREATVRSTEQEAASVRTAT